MFSITVKLCAPNSASNPSRPANSSGKSSNPIPTYTGRMLKFVGLGVKPRVRVWSEEQRNDLDNDAERIQDYGTEFDAPAHMVRLWFEDNGIGIPSESQDKIFTMFQPLNPPGEYEGTGIGLAIVWKAVERMGGKVGVKSEPGRGSKFWIELKAA